MTGEHLGKDVELTLIQKAIGTTVMALIGWIGWTVNDTATRIAVMESQMAGLIDSAGDRYTSTQAASDKAAANARDAAMERRLERLESKHGM